MGQRMDRVKDPATPEEVRVAVESLTRRDVARLRDFASLKIRSLGVDGFGLDAEELIQEAVFRTINRRRNWRKGVVSFVEHLMGVIQSCTSHWKERAQRIGPTITSSDLPRHADAIVDRDPLELKANPDPDAARVLAAREEVEQIEELFRDDEVILQIILGITEGMKGPEIQDTFGLSSNEYEAAVKRMRHKVRSAFPRR